MKIKNFKSTKSLYGVEPEYFAEMKYFDAVRTKVKLAKEMIAEFAMKLDYKTPDVEYVDLNRQLNECEKAREFNERLLDEYSKERKGFSVKAEMIEENETIPIKAQECVKPEIFINTIGKN